jgi:hypothetical protein
LEKNLPSKPYPLRLQGCFQSCALHNGMGCATRRGVAASSKPASMFPPVIFIRSFVYPPSGQRQSKLFQRTIHTLLFLKAPSIGN